MKIGIITIQRPMDNYGAALQCYSLYKYIQDLGHKVEIIDLLRPCHRGYKGPNGKKINIVYFKQLLYDATVRNYYYGKRDREFRHFHQMVEYSKKYRGPLSIKKDPPQYELYVSGSDQIWNPYMPFDNAPYFFDFKIKSGASVISYATSFGVDNIPDSVKELYKQRLLKYSHISVREERGAKIVEEIMGVTPKVVADPVFLQTRQFWVNLGEKVDRLPNGYVLLYSVLYERDVLDYAIRFAEIKNKPLVVVLSEAKVIKNNSIIQIREAGPRQWLYLINNADVFLTNSFHGAAFGALLCKDLKIIYDRKKKTNSRLDTLVSKFQLKECLCFLDSNDTNINSLPSTSIDIIQNCIRLEHEKAINYLKKAINHENISIYGQEY